MTVGSSHVNEYQLQVHDNSKATKALIRSRGDDAQLLIDAKSGKDSLIILQENGTNEWYIRHKSDAASRLQIFDNDNDNGVYLDQDATSWTSNSDVRMKDNLIEITDATEKLNTLRCINYNWNYDSSEKKRLGLIAQEVYKVLGIEAAIQCIHNELMDGFDGRYINYHHTSMLCDRMTATKKMVSIFRHGINNDDIGPIAKASFEETPEMFLKAARHAELDHMRGVSANVMCGQEGYFGTGSFQVVLNIDEMTKLNEKVMEETSEQEKIEQMFGAIDNPDDPCSTTNLSIQTNVANIPEKDLGNIDDDYDAGF